MALKRIRQELRNYFLTGLRPTEENFAELIESNLNILEDKASEAEAQAGSDIDKFITPITARKAIDSYVKVNDKALANGQVTIEVADISNLSSTIAGINSAIANKQDTLVSGTNIRTINGNSLIGNTDLVISSGSSSLNKFNLTSYAKANPNLTTFSTIGTPLTVVGTVTANSVTSSSIYTIVPKVEALITTASITATAGFRQAQAEHFVKNNLRGSYVSFICGIATGATLASKRGFWGLRALIIAPTDTNAPNTILDCIGVSYSSTSGNFQIQHNNNSGAANLVDTGIAVPTTDRSELYKIEITILKGTTSNPIVKITRISDGVSFSYTITSTDIPSSSTPLTFNSYCSVGGTSSVVGFALSELESNIIF